MSVEPACQDGRWRLTSMADINRHGHWRPTPNLAGRSAEDAHGLTDVAESP